MTSAFGAEAARDSARWIRSRLGESAASPEACDIAIVLGSGLGAVVNDVSVTAMIPFGDIPGFPVARVAGHAGALIAGRLGGRDVIALSGRFHMYEGHDARVVGFPVRVLHALGARTLIVSNAAGGLNRLWRAGDLMLIRDHINLTFRNPLVGAVEAGDERFPDMSEPYDRALAEAARQVAAEQGMMLREGIYAGLLGPAYETPAEVRMLAALGADAVGMSTIPEVLVARALGIRVLGLSVIANLASGLSNTPLTHDEVLAATARAATRFSRLVAGVVARIGVAH